MATKHSQKRFLLIEKFPYFKFIPGIQNSKVLWNGFNSFIIEEQKNQRLGLYVVVKKRNVNKNFYIQNKKEDILNFGIGIIAFNLDNQKNKNTIFIPLMNFERFGQILYKYYKEHDDYYVFGFRFELSLDYKSKIGSSKEKLINFIVEMERKIKTILAKNFF